MNEIALLVGGSSGMGKATADTLLRRGVAVWLLSADANKLNATAAELSALGEVKTSNVDLADEPAVDSFIREIGTTDRHISYLINAAGSFNPTTSGVQLCKLSEHLGIAFCEQWCENNACKHERSFG